MFADGYEDEAGLQFGGAYTYPEPPYAAGLEDVPPGHRAPPQTPHGMGAGAVYATNPGPYPGPPQRFAPVPGTSGRYVPEPQVRAIQKPPLADLIQARLAAMPPHLRNSLQTVRAVCANAIAEWRS